MTRGFNEESAEQKAREELKAVFAAWEKAIISNDANAIGRFMTDDWVIVSATGITKKEEFLAVVESGDLKHETFKGDIVLVREYGDAAVVTARTKNHGL